MLELKGITKTYTGEGEDVRALKGIDLQFRNSEFVAVLGPSGCGKTTLLNIIGGLDRFTSGDLIINGTSTSLCMMVINSSSAFHNALVSVRLRSRISSCS